MRYHYTGPADIAAAARHSPPGTPIRSTDDLKTWLAAADPRDRDDPHTYVITTSGVLLLGPRRSEHVACAAGADVLAAGEITVDPHGQVIEVTNQSTGYCPQPSCWPAVEAALDRAAIPHPGAFTSAFVFRHCPTCTHLNVIKDDLYICALCDGPLPPSPSLSPPNP
ncbi:hypothetical protein [Actinoplanes subglobosus]|uniref:Uncharacterized protein n=1 Tax=Actinoplanes subglobosus TaxID=1547892 RepID=A0ABV8IZN1_9ACTN